MNCLGIFTAFVLLYAFCWKMIILKEKDQHTNVTGTNGHLLIAIFCQKSHYLTSIIIAMLKKCAHGLFCVNIMSWDCMNGNSQKSVTDVPPQAASDTPGFFFQTIRMRCFGCKVWYKILFYDRTYVIVTNLLRQSFILLICD